MTVLAYRARFAPGVRRPFVRLRWASMCLAGAGLFAGCLAARAAHKEHIFPRAQAQHANGYLGIEFHDLTDAEATALHEKGTRGVLIVAVDHDGPAGKAGLRPQDVIVSINGQTSATAQMLKRMIHDAGAGVALALALVRQGQNVQVTATLADRGQVERAAMARMAAAPPATPASDPVDSEEGNATYATPPPAPGKHAPARGQTFLGTVLHTGPFTGLELEALTPQLAGFFGVGGGHGLLVQSVADNSPGSDAGLRAGDVVLKADGVAIATTAAWGKHLRAAKGNPVIVTVLRDKHEQQITLVLEAKKHTLVETPHLFGGDE